LDSLTNPTPDPEYTTPTFSIRIVLRRLVAEPEEVLLNRPPVSVLFR
jgi:hypothetical protein